MVYEILHEHRIVSPEKKIVFSVGILYIKKNNNKNNKCVRRTVTKVRKIRKSYQQNYENTYWKILPTLKTHFNELTYNASGLSLLIILIAIIKTITHDFCKSGSFPIAIAATRKFIF